MPTPGSAVILSEGEATRKFYPGAYPSRSRRTQLALTQAQVLPPRISIQNERDFLRRSDGGSLSLQNAVILSEGEATRKFYPGAYPSRSRRTQLALTQAQVLPPRISIQNERDFLRRSDGGSLSLQNAVILSEGESTRKFYPGAYPSRSRRTQLALTQAQVLPPRISIQNKRDFLRRSDGGSLSLQNAVILSKGESTRKFYPGAYPSRSRRTQLALTQAQVLPPRISIQNERDFLRRSDGGSLSLQNAVILSEGEATRKFYPGAYPSRSRRTQIALTQAQVLPPRISIQNERDFLRPSPALQLLLSRDGAQHVRIVLVINELIDFIGFRETFNHALFVFPNAPFQIARNPDIKPARVAAQDVNVARFHNLMVNRGRSFDFGSGTA